METVGAIYQTPVVRSEHKFAHVFTALPALDSLMFSTVFLNRMFLTLILETRRCLHLTKQSLTPSPCRYLELDLVLLFPSAFRVYAKLTAKMADGFIRVICICA